jgi:hypothetical protein
MALLFSFFEIADTTIGKIDRSPDAVIFLHITNLAV